MPHPVVIFRVVIVVAKKRCAFVVRDVAQIEVQPVPCLVAVQMLAIGVEAPFPYLCRFAVLLPDGDLASAVFAAMGLSSGDNLESVEVSHAASDLAVSPRSTPSRSSMKSSTSLLDCWKSRLPIAFIFWLLAVQTRTTASRKVTTA